MDWSNYLLENKSPNGSYAHLGVFDDRVSGIYDLSTLPQYTKKLSLINPLKKTKLQYTHFSDLENYPLIEAIDITELDDSRVKIFSNLKNLKYLHIRVNNQSSLPSISHLESLEILILSGIKKAQTLDFLANLPQLKTLYIFGFNHLYDLTPISTLTNLQELYIDHGKMSGIGKSIKSLDPLKALINLKYLKLVISVENNNCDVSSLLNLKKLEQLSLLNRYLDYPNNRSTLTQNLPFIAEL